MMQYAKQIGALLLTSLTISIACAAGDNLLIQLQHDGSYRVWHAEGATRLSEEEMLAVAATATPLGGADLPTAAGPAHAVETEQGVVIILPEGSRDRMLLIDRDECGGIKTWHPEGATTLTDDQMTELLLTALPGGGKAVPVGDRLAKGFLTKLGVVVVLWKPALRR
jgi:hypothetical protein